MTIFSLIWGGVAILGSIISYALYKLKTFNKDTMVFVLTLSILFPVTLGLAILFGMFHVGVYITKIITIIIKNREWRR